MWAVSSMAQKNLPVAILPQVLEEEEGSGELEEGTAMRGSSLEHN